MTESRVSKSFNDCIRHFTPAWFAVNMGTGIISILFHNFPYAIHSDTMNIFSTIFFFLNLVLYVIFNIMTIFRFTLYPDIWSLMLQHPVQSLYLGTYPMAGITLITIAVALFNEENGIGGTVFLYILWGFWWLDIAVSFLCVFQLVHIMITRQTHELQRMTSVWLLPIVTLVVASSCGGLFVEPMQAVSPSHALLTLAFSCFSVSVGLILAFMILTIYFLRLVTYGYPPGLNIVSAFIPMGPMGQGGYSLLLIGQGAKALFPLAYGNSVILRNQSTGEVIDIVCTCIAFVMWSFSTMWLVYAAFGVQHEARRGHIPFKLSFWGLIFPNGVYANLSIELYYTLDFEFFRVWGAIYSAVVLTLWIIVFIFTVAQARNGTIFEAPCLEESDLSGLQKRTDEKTDGSTVVGTTSCTPSTSAS